MTAGLAFDIVPRSAAEWIACGESNRDGELSDTEDFICEKRFQIGGVDRGHGNGLPKGVEDLNGVCLLATWCGMMIDYLDYISRAKVMG
jgi:hypothetical protein